MGHATSTVSLCSVKWYVTWFALGPGLERIIIRESLTGGVLSRKYGCSFARCPGDLRLPEAVLQRVQKTSSLWFSSNAERCLNFPFPLPINTWCWLILVGFIVVHLCVCVIMYERQAT